MFPQIARHEGDGFQIGSLNVTRTTGWSGVIWYVLHTSSIVILSERRTVLKMKDFYTVFERTLTFITDSKRSFRPWVLHDGVFCDWEIPSELLVSWSGLVTMQWHSVSFRFHRRVIHFEFEWKKWNHSGWGPRKVSSLIILFYPDPREKKWSKPSSETWLQ